MHVSHADVDIPPISTSERNERVFLLRTRFTGCTNVPAQHLHSMVKMFSLPFDPKLSEVDILTLETLAKSMGLPEKKIPDDRIFM